MINIPTKNLFKLSSSHLTTQETLNLFLFNFILNNFAKKKKKKSLWSYFTVPSYLTTVMTTLHENCKHSTAHQRSHPKHDMLYVLE